MASDAASLPNTPDKDPTKPLTTSPGLAHRQPVVATVHATLEISPTKTYFVPLLIIYRIINYIIDNNFKR